MKASEARKVCLGQIQMSEREIFRDIKRVSQWGSYSAVFVKNQLSDEVRKNLRQQGYRLIEDEMMITVAWNE